MAWAWDTIFGPEYGLRSDPNYGPANRRENDPYYPSGGVLGAGGGFNIPTGAYPQSSGSSQSSQMQAINWGDPLGAKLLPLLQNAASTLPGYVESIPGLLQGSYSSLMNQAMSPQNFQGTLNELAGRGILNSTITKDTMADVAGQAAQNIANQAYLSQLQGIEAQMNLPNILGNLAELSRTALAQSSSQESYSNKLAPYELMANLLKY